MAKVVVLRIDSEGNERKRLTSSSRESSNTWKLCQFLGGVLRVIRRLSNALGTRYFSASPIATLISMFLSCIMGSWCSG